MNTTRRPSATRGKRVTAFLASAALLVAACSPSVTTPPVPLPTGAQTTVRAMGFSAMAVDAQNVLYLAGAGVSTLAPGATRPAPLKLAGSPTVATLAVAPDGRMFFVSLDGVVETVPPGSTTPQPLPFGTLPQFSQIAVGHDGAVYLGDGRRDKLLRLAPGATAPTELDVSGVDGPGHLVIDAHDNLFVSMRGTIVEITKDADTTEPVAGASAHVGGLAVDTAGDLYATDVEAGTVSRLPAGGGEWQQLPFRGLQSPTAIAVDGDGNVYVRHRGSELVRLAAK